MKRYVGRLPDQRHETSIFVHAGQNVQLTAPWYEARVDSWDSEIDVLFTLAPDAMVEARNALATRIRKAGDAALATRVKALKRPTPAAWALNQLHFGAPELLAAAQAQAARMRALHARDHVDPEELRDAAQAQRAAINRVVEHALARCAEEGLPHGVPHQRKLLATVQGWLSGSGDELPGRMTHDLEPPGFSAVTTVGAARASTPAMSPNAPVLARNEVPVPREAALERARAELSARQRRAREAQALLAQRQRELHERESALAELEARVRDGEAQLLKLRERAEAHAKELARQRSLVDEASTARDHTREQLHEAERALSALEKKR